MKQAELGWVVQWKNVINSKPIKKTSIFSNLNDLMCATLIVNVVKVPLCYLYADETRPIPDKNL